MNVIIANNIKKQSARIDVNGNEIDPRTKQVIKPNVPDSVLPPPVSKVGSELPLYAPPTSTGSSDLDAKIEQKVEEYRQSLIEKAKAALDNL